MFQMVILGSSNYKLMVFRYVSDSNLTTMTHMDGLFAKTFIPPDSLVSVYAGEL